jgi:hypothetical protein
VKAGRVAAAASQRNRLWNFVDLVYLNQGTENTGYVTPAYLRRRPADVSDREDGAACFTRSTRRP